MGGAVSAGEDNDELIDNLVEAEYIKSHTVECIFRAVDRGDYYLEGCKENAYRDLAWKHGHIHLSAPCIYSEVMESLQLGPGMSFLNLGSGTGYLSTMAGLLLGTYGTNHGIELHEEVVDYAKSRLEDFQNSSPAMDKYEFCPPNFVVGNCLLLDSTLHQYDRVYCGASCPTEHENYMKNLVRIGGILVMPLNDHLLKVTRTSETTFEAKSVLPVSFASLVLPNKNDTQVSVKLPEMHPLTLQEICRSTIRVILRTNVEAENPSLLDKKRVIKPKKSRGKRNLKRIVIPLLQGGVLDDDFPEQPDRHSDQSEAEDPPSEERGQSSDDSKIVLDFSFDPSKRHSETSEEETAEPQDMELEGGSSQKEKGGNGDSGIDNISDDSFLESDYAAGSSDPASSYEDRPFLKRSAEEDCEHDPRNCIPQKYPHCRSSNIIFKRVAFSDADSDECDEMDSDSGTDYHVAQDVSEEKNNLLTYTHLMKVKIDNLPLPQTLKSFLHFSRPV